MHQQAVLEIVNTVRRAQGLSALGAISFNPADPLAPADCALERAMSCEFGPSEHPQWEREEAWVLRFVDPVVTAAVGEAVGEPWSRDHLEVRAPEALVGVAVAFHYGLVMSDDAGYLKAWIEPSDETEGLWELNMMPGYPYPAGHGPLAVRAV